jgi:hypothetical protein
MSADPTANIELIKKLAPQDNTMRDIMAKRYAEMSSPEALAAQKKKDFWGALAQIGFGMAGSNSPYFLQAAGQAASAALPGMAQAAKERKAQELAGLQGQLSIETANNQASSALAKLGVELAQDVDEGRRTQANADRTFDLAKRQLEADIADRSESRRLQRAGLALRGSGGGGRQMTAGEAAQRSKILETVRAELESGDRKKSDYHKLKRENPVAAELYVQKAADQRINYVFGGGGNDRFSGLQ